MARVIYFIDGFSASAWYRCFTPCGHLEAAGHEVMMTQELTPDRVEWGDVVVFERRYGPDVMDAIAYARSLGKRTVYELDDDLWNIHARNPAKAVLGRPDVLASIESCIRACDVVTTTTARLAERLRPLNRHVHVLPNMLPDEFWPFDTPKEQSQERIVVGWAGSATHAADLDLLGDAMRIVLDRYPNVDFAFAGAERQPVQHERAYMIAAVDVQQYPLLLSAFDIGLAPLEDTVFNRSKSDLKVLEYSMTGIPVIASKVEPYSDFIAQGENGFLARNAKDWLKYLTRLVQDAELRSTVGAKAQAAARRRLMGGRGAGWERAYGL